MSTQNDLSQSLASLGSFSEDEVRAIRKAGTLITVPKGWAPILEGTPADKVYLILEGQVSVRKRGVEVAQLGAGELVGETALSRRKLRNATVVALTPLRVMHFTASAWADLQARVPGLAEASNSRALARA